MKWVCYDNASSGLGRMDWALFMGNLNTESVPVMVVGVRAGVTLTTRRECGESIYVRFRCAFSNRSSSTNIGEG